MTHLVLTPETMRVTTARQTVDDGCPAQDTHRARPVAEKYKRYPVPKWRRKFAAVLEQLDEATGVGVSTPGDRQATLQRTALHSTSHAHFQDAVVGLA